MQDQNGGIEEYSSDLLYVELYDLSCTTNIIWFNIPWLYDDEDIDRFYHSYHNYAILVKWRKFVNKSTNLHDTEPRISAQCTQDLTSVTKEIDLSQDEPKQNTKFVYLHNGTLKTNLHFNDRAYYLVLTMPNTEMEGNSSEEAATDPSLARIKLSNKHLRSNFTRIENTLRGLMEHNAKETLIEENFTKLSKIQDTLAKNLTAILDLPPDQCNQSLLSNELKSRDKYDNSFTDISTMICTYKYTPAIETHASHTGATRHDADEESDGDDYRDARERPRSSPQIKFAPIKLPQFSGDVTAGENDFADWINLFNVSVNNIEDDSIKHIYLIQSLKGKALKLVSNIPASTIGLASALSILTQHFGNQKRTLHLTLKALVNYDFPLVQQNRPPSVTYRDNWSSLLTLVRGVQNAKKDGFGSDDLLASLVQMKLNPNISVEVERIISNKTEATDLEELFEIVNNLIMSHEVSECSRSFTTKNNISTPADDHQNTTRSPTKNFNRAPKCIFCGTDVNDHYSARCGGDMSTALRREKVKEFGCCFNCLMTGGQPNSHNAANCPTKHKKCRHCIGAHHFLLCFKSKDPTMANPPNAGRSAGAPF